MQFFRLAKKPIVLAITTISLAFLSVANLRAETTSDSTSILAAIKTNTDNILSNVSGLPNYIASMLTYLNNLTAADDSVTTSEMVPNFMSIVTASKTNQDLQNSKQNELIAAMVGKSIADFSPAKANAAPAVLNDIPQINSISYPTVLGLPPVAKGTGTPLDYIKNAAGLSMYHDFPNANWRSSDLAAKNRYTGYYNAVTAVESYDAYLLSSLWAEITNGNQLTAAQTNLLNKATDQNWLKDAAGKESIGTIFRQILLFQSQTYVLITQMLQLQKQQLAATAMNNTLLIANAQQTESLLLGKAQGTIQ